MNEASSLTEEPPKQYGTFDGPYYLAIWRGMFRAVLGWSDQQTEAWASRYSEYLRNPDDMIFIQPPIYWANLTLIPDTLRKRLNSSELLKLTQRIDSASHADPDDADPTAIDWEPFRKEVEQILAEYAPH